MPKKELNFSELNLKQAFQLCSISPTFPLSNLFCMRKTVFMKHVSILEKDVLSKFSESTLLLLPATIQIGASQVVQW